eukprot:scaffold744_cov370-Prasinococcus_capsulatus_cf.AAC.9
MCVVRGVLLLLLLLLLIRVTITGHSCTVGEASPGGEEGWGTALEPTWGWPRLECCRHSVRPQGWRQDGRDGRARDGREHRGHPPGREPVDVAQAG